MALWNACLPSDTISIRRFCSLFLFDPNFKAEGALVAEVEGKPVGFLLAIYRRAPLGIYSADPKQGWITTFFVAPKFRRIGIGRSMMQAGLAYLRGCGCQVISCNGYAPSYAFPGIDHDYRAAICLVRRCGFQYLTDAVSMEMSLEGWEKPVAVADRQVKLESEGICLRRVQPGDALALLSFAEQHYPYWHQSIVDGLQVEMGNVYIAVQGGNVLAFAQWENPQTDPPNGARCRFGPFGVRPDLRSQGLGAVLFQFVIESVVKAGADRLWFGWAGGRNLPFYERAGCRITRRYQLFQYRWE